MQSKINVKFSLNIKTIVLFFFPGLIGHGMIMSLISIFHYEIIHSRFICNIHTGNSDDNAVDNKGSNDNDNYEKKMKTIRR